VAAAESPNLVSSVKHWFTAGKEPSVPSPSSLVVEPPLPAPTGDAKGEKRRSLKVIVDGASSPQVLISTSSSLSQSDDDSIKMSETDSEGEDGSKLTTSDMYESLDFLLSTPANKSILFPDSPAGGSKNPFLFDAHNEIMFNDEL
jgi:hypothetical protein